MIGNTKISLLNGTEPTIKELSDKSEKFWVYSCDENCKIVVGLAYIKKLGLSEVIKITLDNQQEIRCSSKQLFLTRNGNKIESSSLSCGDSLMPLYKKISSNNLKGYEQIRNPGSKSWIYTHRVVMSQKEGGQYSGDVVHHINFNKNDNSPENLQTMSWDEHTVLHSQNVQLLKGYSQSEIGRETSRKNMNKLWQNPEWKAQSLERIKQNGKNTSRMLTASGQNGFQAMDKLKLSEICRRSAVKRGTAHLHTQSAKEKRLATLKEKMSTDANFRKITINTAIKNLQTYNENLKNGNTKLTTAQIEARKENARKMCYNRFHKDKYSTYEEYIKAKYPNNHKIVSIEKCGLEEVYQIIVEGFHNFAIASGVFLCE